MTQTAYDAELKGLFDAAQKVMEATAADERATRAAISRLEKVIAALGAMEQRLTVSLGQTAAAAKQAIEQSAEATATKTAALLQEKFTQADQAAERAAQRYRNAARSLCWRALVLAVCTAILLLAGAWMLVQWSIPSREEIEAREQRIADQTRRIEMLDQQESKLKLAKCKDNQNRHRLCVETDESTESASFIDRSNGKTYRILKGF